MLEKDFIFVFYGILLLVCNISGGYRLDEQLNYPHDDKHSIKLSKGMRKYIFLIDKNHKHECLRAAYIQEIVGYIEFLISIVVTVVLLIIGYVPVWTVTITVIFTVLGIDVLYTMVVYFYYKVKFK